MRDLSCGLMDMDCVWTMEVWSTWRFTWGKTLSRQSLEAFTRYTRRYLLPSALYNVLILLPVIIFTFCTFLILTFLAGLFSPLRRSAAAIQRHKRKHQGLPSI